jgi:hypothetical protein
LEGAGPEVAILGGGAVSVERDHFERGGVPQRMRGERKSGKQVTNVKNLRKEQ